MARHCLCNSEVNHLGPVTLVGLANKNVRWLEVAVNQSLHVRVMHGVADFCEQVQALANGEASLVAESNERFARCELHREVGLTIWSCSCIEDLGESWMIHHRERLLLGLEPRSHRGRGKREFEDL